MEGRDPVNADRYKHYVCPGCGAEVPVGSAGCPKCNAHARGKEPQWAGDHSADGLDLPGGYSGEDDFDYDSFIEREFGDKSAKRRLRNVSLLRQGLREVLIGIGLMLIGIALLWMLLTV